MKTKLVMSFLVMGLFFSLQARELTTKEKLVLSTYKRTLEVKDYMETHIDEDELTWRQWGEYRLLLKSCLPVNSLRKKILAASDEDQLKDQSDKLHVLYQGCKEGVLSLTRLYTQVNP